MTAPCPAPPPTPAAQRASASPAAQASGRPPTTVSSRRWRSADLFGPTQEIEIEHGESVYRLRRTSLGKLILTK